MLGTGYDRALQAGSRRFRWVYVIIDKFSKWIEYKPSVSGTSQKAAELLDEIIHGFSLPNRIITDLGSTFTSNDF
jgi:transposase InsO family protein